LNKELIGIVAGVIVFITLIPYAWRVYHGKIQPNLTSWFLWTVIAFALLITYWGSGARENVWMAVVGCINPFLITILVAVKYPSKIRMNKLELVCLAIGIVSLALWFVFRNQKPLVQYALYVAILADGCAAVPTAVAYWQDPKLDRPFAWGVFCLASVMNIFAIPEQTFANYAYPVYMAIGSGFITLPLILYRVRMSVPLKEWA
jgi:hypothetical protein